MHWRALAIVYFIAGMLDAMTTYIGLGQGHEEKNPAMSVILERNVVEFYAIKIIMTILVTVLMYNFIRGATFIAHLLWPKRVVEYDPMMALAPFIILFSLVCLQIFVVVNNFMIISGG